MNSSGIVECGCTAPIAKDGDDCVDWAEQGKDEIAAEAVSAARNSRRFKRALLVEWLAQFQTTCRLRKRKSAIHYPCFFRLGRFSRVICQALSGHWIFETRKRMFVYERNSNPKQFPKVFLSTTRDKERA